MEAYRVQLRLCTRNRRASEIKVFANESKIHDHLWHWPPIKAVEKRAGVSAIACKKDRVSSVEDYEAYARCIVACLIFAERAPLHVHLRRVCTNGPWRHSQHLALSWAGLHVRVGGGIVRTALMPGSSQRRPSPYLAFCASWRKIREWFVPGPRDEYEKSSGRRYEVTAEAWCDERWQYGPPSESTWRKLGGPYREAHAEAAGLLMPHASQHEPSPTSEAPPFEAKAVKPIGMMDLAVNRIGLTLDDYKQRLTEDGDGDMDGR